MGKFLGMNRVCVPLSLDCDMSCRYCYRNAGRIPKVPGFNDLMREFLGQLDPTKTQALVASGGEPLLHWDKVKELFSYAPRGMHLKVMTNGLNLTQEIVDYLNKHNVETYVSHDGDVTEWLRGEDVLSNPELLRLIKQINHLTFSCVCTNRNPDPWECYQQIKKRVNRDFYFHYNAVFAEEFCSYLIEDFDYEAWQRGVLLCEAEDLDWHNPIPRFYKGTGVNVLPNGDLVGMCEIHHKYGTVLSTYEEVVAARKAYGDLRPCSVVDCEVYEFCKDFSGSCSKHFCAQRRKKIECKIALAELKHDDRDVYI